MQRKTPRTAKRKRNKNLEITVLWDENQCLRVAKPGIDNLDHSFTMELDNCRFSLMPLPETNDLFVMDRIYNTHIYFSQNYYLGPVDNAGSVAEPRKKKQATEPKPQTNDFSPTQSDTVEQAPFRLLHPDAPMMVFGIHNIPPNTYFEPLHQEVEFFELEKNDSDGLDVLSQLSFSEEKEDKGKEKEDKGKEKVKGEKVEKEKEKEKPSTTNDKKRFKLNDEIDVRDLETVAEFKYIQSDKDRVDLVSIVPIARLSVEGKMQYGVVADKRIATGTKITSYLGEEIHPNDARIENHCYLFNINKHKALDASKIRSMGGFVNHSAYSYNTRYHLEGDQVVIIASAPIAQGEQLLVSYEDDYNFGSDQCFLHPTDDDKTPSELFDANKKHYDRTILNLKNVKYDLTPLGISESASIYAPKPIQHLLKKPSVRLSLDANYPMYLPILQVNDQQQFLPFAQQERITALMLAAYVGNKNAIQALFNLYKSPKLNYAEIQQSKSGKTALHLLFMGARLDTNIKMKKQRQEEALPEFFKHRQIKTLIQIKDQDGKSPIFTAIDEAPPELLKAVIKTKKISISEMLSLYNNNGLDPFLYAIAEKKYEHAMIFLKAMLSRNFDYANYLEQLSVTSRGIIRGLLVNLSDLQDITSKKHKAYTPKLFEISPIHLDANQLHALAMLTEVLKNKINLYPNQPSFSASS